MWFFLTFSRAGWEKAEPQDCEEDEDCFSHSGRTVLIWVFYLALAQTKLYGEAQKILEVFLSLVPDPEAEGEDSVAMLQC